MTTYTYSVALDTLSGALDERTLHSEIVGSNITISLDRIDASGDVIDCVFKAAISAQEKADLDSIVSAHAGLNPVDKNEVTISQSESDTGGISVTNKVGPTDSYQQIFETEWESSKLNSIHEKDIDNNDIGWSSTEFYKDVAGVETIMDSPTQAELDADCIRTDLIWSPDITYWILSGQIGHFEETSGNFYCWARGSDSLGNLVFVEGGINLRFLSAYGKIGVKGRAVTAMPKTFAHPTYGPLPANKIRVVSRHGAGVTHRVQLIINMFRLKP